MAAVQRRAFQSAARSSSGEEGLLPRENKYCHATRGNSGVRILRGAQRSPRGRIETAPGFRHRGTNETRNASPNDFLSIDRWFIAARARESRATSMNSLSSFVRSETRIRGCNIFGRIRGDAKYFKRELRPVRGTRLTLWALNTLRRNVPCGRNILFDYPKINKLYELVQLMQL